jgi:hypothetical protein
MNVRTGRGRRFMGVRGGDGRGRHMRSAKKPTTAAVKPTAIAANIQKAAELDCELSARDGPSAECEAGCEATRLSFIA